MSENFQIIQWRESVTRKLILDICKLVTNLLFKVYIAEIREIDSIQRAPGFSYRRLQASRDEVDFIQEAEIEEEQTE